MLRGALFALSLLTALAAPAYAVGLEATQTVERAVITIDETGAETVAYEIAEELSPGDELRYTISYLNADDKPAQNVKLSMPVPAEVNYVEGSAKPGTAEISYSVDGETYAARTALKIQTPEGERSAAAEDIRFIRWSFTDGISPAGAGQISYSGVLK
jgi:uncharacterized repeat protein (TIGR01451 family)